MRRASRIAMLMIGSLGCGCVLADDSDIPAYESALITDYDVPLELPTRSDWYKAINELEFQDNSTLGRLKRVREVSFLTLVETRQSRIFLGVNSDGLVGLHFRIR